MARKGWKILGGVFVGALLLVGGFVGLQIHAYDTSMEKQYDVPLPKAERSSDAEVLARGKHLTESVGACTSADCHGADLAGGRSIAMGPVATLTGPNITAGGKRAGGYTAAELSRLLRHGLKRDGRSVTFMPVHELSWLPQPDMTAIGSYLATVAAVDKADGETRVKPLGKILDRRDKMVLDVARRINHAATDDDVPAPEPTARYGRFVARACTGCHGDRLSGGPIPGAPSSMPIPANITPHETALKAWTYDDFTKLLSTGVKRDGKQLNPFMPIDALSKLNETERRALWEYLRTVPPLPFGMR